MFWGRRNSPKNSPKCTPLINGLEICDRVKPRHKSVNLSNMSVSDVVSVNKHGAHFDKNFCVTVDNTDALEVFHHLDKSIAYEGQDAIKGKPLPPTVVCVDGHKANTYLGAFGDPRKFGQFVHKMGECSVKDIRQVVHDAYIMKNKNPNLGTEEIRAQLNYSVCHKNVIDQVIDNVYVHQEQDFAFDSGGSASAALQGVGGGEQRKFVASRSKGAQLLASRSKGGQINKEQLY